MDIKLLNERFLRQLKQAGKKIDFSIVDDKTRDLYRRGFLWEFEVYEKCPNCLVNI